MHLLFEQLFGDAARLTLGAPAADATTARQHALGGVPAAPTDRRVRAGRRKALRGAPYASFDESTFAGPTDARDYKLFIPAGAADCGLPLVVMLHGCSQSPDDFAAGTRMNEVAQERGFLVLYPAQAPRSNHSKCWNWFLPTDQRRGAGEPELLAAMTRHIVATHGVDPARVWVAGLSAGGAMADILGREYPDLFAAVGVHSGVPHGAAHDMASAFAVMRSGSAGLSGAPDSSVLRRARKGVRLQRRRAATIVFHGDRDSTVHPSNGEELIGALLGASGPGVVVREQASLAGRAITRTVHRRAGAAAPSLAEHWVVHGAGHAWSGGSAQGSYTDPVGPNATREMVRFFEEHPMPAR